MSLLPRVFGPAGLAAVALVVTSALSACGDSATRPSSRDHGSGPSVLDVSVRGTSFTEVPPTVHPGTVTLLFRNSDSRRHMAAIARLVGGHTAADIPAFLASDQARQGPPPWLQIVGGVDELDPGERGGWTGILEAGSYVVASFSPDRQGRPELADGLLAAFRAEGTRVEAPLPATRARVTLGAGGMLTMSSVPAGTTAVTLINDDATTRTVDLTSVEPGRTYHDVLKEAQQGTGVPASLVRLGGTVVPPHSRVVAGIEPARRGTTYVVFDIDHIGEGAIAHETVR